MTRISSGLGYGKNQLLKFSFVLIVLLVWTMSLVFLSPFSALAEDESLDPEQQEMLEPETARGKVIAIERDFEKEQFYSEFSDGYAIEYYKVKIELKSGKSKGQLVEAEHVIDQRMVYKLEIDRGDQVLVYLERDQQGNIINAFISDIYRQNILMLLLIMFLLALVALGGWKGLKTIVTLFLTGIAVVKFLLPGLLAGYNPILLTVVICAIVTTLTLLIVSGAGRKTLAAILGTTGGVMMAGIIAYIFGSVAKLTGLGDEQAQMLAFIPQGTGFDYQGLLFAGIILGSLGAVMDVGMSIASAMSEIEAVKPDIRSGDLFKAGLNVGRDVMGTMSNTLILAYAGTSLPLLLLFLAHQTPVQEFLNWDMIATEIVRALAGSIGLVLTVPLTALVTVVFRTRRSPRISKNLM